MYCKYEGDVLCQSVMSHLNKCISSGSASLAFSMYIHHINVTRQKHPICIADSLVGAKVCESARTCVGLRACLGVCAEKMRERKRETVTETKENKQKQRGREDSKAERVKLRPGGVLGYLHM